MTRCPVCRSHVDRAQPSDPTKRGPWIAYPCQCWLTPAQATGLPTTGRTAR